MAQANCGLLALVRPSVDKKEAVRLAGILYGLCVSDLSQVKEFVGYDDRNFYIKGTLPNHPNSSVEEDEFVLKILNHVDSENISFVNAQNEVMLYLKEHGFICPVPIMALNGEYAIQYKTSYSEISGAKDKPKGEQMPVRAYAVRLLRFVPGLLLKDVRCTSYLLFSLGCYIAKMNKALQSFKHPGIVPLLKKEWDLSKLFVLEKYISVASHDDSEQQVFQQVYGNFVNKVIPQLGKLKQHIIHGDLNDENILVSPRQCGGGHEISSVLDFGDVAVSYRVFDVAICLKYMIVLRAQQGDPHDKAIKAVGHFLRGYQGVYDLSSDELALLYWSVAARFFQSIVIGRYKQSLEPDNIYLSQSSLLEPQVLSSYIAVSEEEILKCWLSNSCDEQF